MKQLLFAMTMLAALVGTAQAGDLTVAPASVSFGEIHPRETMAVSLTLTNQGARPLKKVTCKGAQWKFSGKPTLAPGQSAVVVATYTEGKKPRTEGRLELTITCGGVKVPLLGTRSVFAPAPAPADAAALAAYVVGPSTGAWIGQAFSPQEKLVNAASCGSPMQGDPDTCCTVSLRDLTGKDVASWVVQADGCTRPGARPAADLIKELTARFGKRGWIPVSNRYWGNAAAVVGAGRLLTWHDGAIWLGDQRLADLASQPTGLGVSADGLTVLVRSADGGAAITLPAP